MSINPNGSSISQEDYPNIFEFHQNVTFEKKTLELARAGDADGVVKAGNSISEIFMKDRILKKSCKALAQAKDADGVVKVSNAISMDFIRVQVIRASCHTFAQAKDADGVVKVGNSISDEFTKDFIFEMCCLIFAQAKDADGVIKVGNAVSDKIERDIIFKEISERFIQAKDSVLAAKVANAISEEFIRDGILKSIEDFSPVKDVDEAIKEGHAISNDFIKGKFFGKKRRESDQNDDFDGMEIQSSDKREKDTELSSHNNRYYRDNAIASAKAGNVEGAIKNTESISDIVEKDSALHVIVIILAQTKNANGALKVASLISCASKKEDACSDMCKILLEAGDEEEAIRLAESTLELFNYSNAYLMVLAKLGRVIDAIEKAKSIDDEIKRSQALSVIVDELVLVKKYELAIGVSMLIPDAVKRGYAIHTIAVALPLIH